ncbi:MAG: histidinol dehydrogenase [Sphaerospermopsis sp. SIO1G2]|nr:histidinol dehydrogenase [Sphaerospermopsis sp. SIO1G2]
MRTQLQTFLAARKQAGSVDIAATVREIIADVQTTGDDALIRMSARYDGLSLSPDRLHFSAQEIKDIAATCSHKVVEALTFAAQRIEEYHQRQRPSEMAYEDAYGNLLGMSWHAVDAAGIYVPGGKASYPSSVLMNAIPARVAGVERIAMVVPTPHGAIDPSVIKAAQIAGIDEIYRIGGAQAITALAYGTETIAPVNVIAGPGNAYVAEAKRQLYGVVGIDMVAGPSEIAIIADGSVEPAWIAADMLSQAEHDTLAQSLLITHDADYAAQVEAAINQHLATLTRRDIASASLREYGAIILCDTLEDAASISNLIAPEHLELAVRDPEALRPLIRHAGAIFMGAYTPEAVGDYVAGPSHVLPTAQTASFASGLSVYQFMKKTSIIACSAQGFAALAGPTATLAECEGLGGHALSATIRQ